MSLGNDEIEYPGRLLAGPLSRHSGLIHHLFRGCPAELAGYLCRYGFPFVLRGQVPEGEFGRKAGRMMINIIRR
jgi:hypothetical protein